MEMCFLLPFSVVQFGKAGYDCNSYSTFSWLSSDDSYHPYLWISLPDEGICSTATLKHWHQGASSFEVACRSQSFSSGRPFYIFSGPCLERHKFT